MGTTMPLSLQAFLNSRTIASRSASFASIGTRSLSCKLTPQAPISPRMAAISVGGSVGRTTSPKGSRPRLPSVHSPKENLSAGFGWYALLALIEIPRWVHFYDAYLQRTRGSSREHGPTAIDWE